MAVAQRSASTLSLNPIHSNAFESLREELFDIIKGIVMSNRNLIPAYFPRGPPPKQNQAPDSNFRYQRPQHQRVTSHEQNNFWASQRQFDRHNNWQNNRKNSKTNRFRPNRQGNLPVSISGVGSRQISVAGANHSQ